MLSPSARFSALALLAIVVPAAIVAVLGYVSIRQWEASSELLYREQARDMAAMAAEKVEMTLRRAEDAFLDRLQAALRSGTPPERAVDELLADSPLIRRLYLVDPRGELIYPRAWREGDQAMFGPLVSTTAVRRLERDGKTIANQVCLALLTQRAGEPVVVAFLRDTDTLRREILETTLGTLESSTIIAVLDHEGRTIYSRAPIGDAQRVLSVGFREALPDWRVAVYQLPGASPRQAVRRQVMLFTGALGVLVAVIVAGIVATWQLMRRETEMARLKSDFVANVSHDLKTPLSVIRMFGETLEMGRVTDEGRRQEYYRVITREGERLSRLIDNVLDFSRIEGGRQTYDMAPTSVEPLIRSTLEAFAYPLAQHGFKIEVSVAADLPEVTMDVDAVGQALANLIDNAMEADRVRGLELGADDYVAKPFSLRELLARVRAVLRRPGPRARFEEFAFGDVRVRPRARQVFKAGQEVRLTRKEFDLLVFLTAHRGEVITRERLLDEVRGYERFPTTRTVDTHVLRLRRKFEADADHPVWIRTLHGHGYKFATG